jgi:hypothetical protein
VAVRRRSFAEETALVEARAGRALVLEGARGVRVLASPGLQGRVLTLRVGGIESTGFVNERAIEAGEVDPRFNNFGGVDRFWLGPEGGQFGLYFPPRADLSRETWRVPEALDRGAFSLAEADGAGAVLTRDMKVTSYAGRSFEVSVRREIRVLAAEDLHAELGVELPEGVCHGGVSSRNRLTNAGPEPWDPAKGLIGIWILGMFDGSDATVVIAPFRPGDDGTLGPPFNDDYFGRVSVEAPERLKVLQNAVLFRADARRVGKFGISQRRTTGLAGAMDFARDLLTIVHFDVPPVLERYGNSTWVKEQREPYGGDAFQSYNSGVPGRPGELAAEAPFYELESASPVRPLRPGESLEHRHATHHFQGERGKLAAIARKLLGVDLEEVERAILR